MQIDIEEYVKTCHACQLTKKQQKKYGHLPAKKAEVTPWERVNVDQIGPYTIKSGKKEYQLRAMTMINPATSWFEIARISDKSSNKAQNFWLSMVGIFAICARERLGLIMVVTLNTYLENYVKTWV